MHLFRTDTTNVAYAYAYALLKKKQPLCLRYILQIYILWI